MRWRASTPAITYARDRSQFGHSIAGFQLVHAKLATMAGATTAMQLYCFRLAQLQEAAAMTGSMASLAKLHNVRQAKLVCSEARDILGGNGLLIDYHVSRHLTDTSPTWRSSIPRRGPTRSSH